MNDRMKKFYEKRSNTYLTRRTPAIIRIDGKAFHTYTKGLNKPFDDVIFNQLEYYKELTQAILKSVEYADN